jgi:hypothetical protein
MANNYTQFSEQIDNVTPEQAEWIEKILGFDFDDARFEGEEQARAAFADLVGVKVEELPEELDGDWWPGFEWSTRGAECGSLWLYCEEGYQEDNLVFFVQSYIRRWRPDLIFTLSGACTCSKLRLNEFGGIWLVITKDDVVGGSTWGEIEQGVDALTPVEKGDGKPT